jgi:uncharacterized membrane protein YbhN (UPF0104 family)
LKLVGTVVVVAFALYTIGPAQVGRALSHADLRTSAIALLLISVSIGLLYARWYAMLRPLSLASAREHARIYLWATFLNSFTPANVGGDVYRVAALAGPSASRTSLVGLLLRERVLGLLGYLIGFVGAVLVSRAQGPVDRVFAVGAVAAGIAAIAVLQLPRLLPLLGRNRLVRHRPWPSRAIAFAARSTHLGEGNRPALLIAISLAAWLAWAGAVAVVGTALGLHLGLAAVAAVASLSELVRLVPVTLQGIGVRESAFAVLATSAGSTPEAAFATATLAYLLLTVVLLACAPASWLLAARSPRGPQPASSSDITSQT